MPDWLSVHNNNEEQEQPLCLLTYSEGIHLSGFSPRTMSAHSPILERVLHRRKRVPLKEPGSAYYYYYYGQSAFFCVSVSIYFQPSDFRLFCESVNLL